jgi:hypothetical protein
MERDYQGRVFCKPQESRLENIGAGFEVAESVEELVANANSEDPDDENRITSGSWMLGILIQPATE